MNTTHIMRSDDLRAENRHRILQTLRTHGAMSRAEIGKHTGLSQATLSLLFSLMTEQGIVTSQNQNATVQKRGRPKTTVALDASAALAVTVALTIDQLIFSLVNYEGKKIAQTDLQLDTRALDSTGLYKVITAGINNVIKPQGIKHLSAISIGFQGVTDTASGELLWSPILTMDKVPIGTKLKKVFGVPVSVNNDCGLIAKALHHQEKDKLGDSFAAVLFSHGIGLGVYIAGKPFSGAYSSALELGHVQYDKNGMLCRCGKRGCIEAYAANYGILRSASKHASHNIPSGPISDQDMERIISAANNNQPAETAAFQLAGKAIGFGLATVFTLLDPLPVALVGHNTDAMHLMKTDIELALKTVGRSPTDYSKLLHCFDQHTPLLHNGLILEAMSMIDRNLSQITEDDIVETELS